MSVPCLLLSALSAVKVCEGASLPNCGDVGRVVHRSQNEDDITGLIRGRRDEGLPAQSGQPAGNIAEDLLHTGRGELGHPVVLSTRAGRHRCHLCHRGYDGDGQDPSCKERPDGALTELLVMI